MVAAIIRTEDFFPFSRKRRRGDTRQSMGTGAAIVPAPALCPARYDVSSAVSLCAREGFAQRDGGVVILDIPAVSVYDYTSLRSRDVIKELEAAGWRRIGQTGSMSNSSIRHARDA